MQCDCHCQNDCKCEEMILILFQFCLDFKVQSCLVTLTSLSLAYCMFIPVSVSCLIVVCRLVDRQQFLFSFIPGCLESTHNTYNNEF